MKVTRSRFLTLAAPLSLALTLACGDQLGTVDNPVTPGQTDFVNAEPDNGGGRDYGGGMAGAAPEASADGNKAAPPSPEPPQGRTGEVEEADIYRVDKDRLFYLNTYRGFVIYDLKNPKQPKRVSRLPVFGYPIEMFVSGNTVYALLRDALYLKQKQGKLQFERHNVSQLVAIDISDINKPTVIQTTDIKGMLREGVSRKIEDTIYVVSYMPQHYYWGWRYSQPQGDRKEQAWVYSFNVADPKNPKLIEELKVFEGGSYNYHDDVSGQSGHKNFSQVAISATSNTLMVVENWRLSGYVPDTNNRCGSYSSAQQAVVSLIDISDPGGKISLYSRFKTAGALTDQFKMTYVFDPASKKATFYGIFARREWSGSDCQGSSTIANTIEAWDVTDGAKPQVASTLKFGKPNETVRGSAFDPDRKVAYAITARQIDPLYVIDTSDPTKLKVLSEIDGLSGDMNVFRLVGGGKFLMGIGRDNTEACTGFEGQNAVRSTQVAVSLIDVQKLDGIRLVQRRCVAIEDAQWVGSAVNRNLDQAHKMIGMHSDSQVNLVSVPVYYYKKNGDDDWWWWYTHETAVGLMSYDLSAYDETKDEKQQQVLINHGTVVHENGQVRRSIIFDHQGLGSRVMVNLSDTHVSLTDIDDLDNPVALSTIEVAPYYSELYRFGDYIVEHIREGQYHGNESLSEFRVKAVNAAKSTQTALEDQAPVKVFSVGQVRRVIKHGDKLVLFRVLPKKEPQTKGGYYYGEDTEVLVYDLSDPKNPKQGGSATFEGNLLPYYRYWCGVGGYWGGYFFDNNRNWAMTDSGVVFLQHHYDYQSKSQTRRLQLLDLTTSTPQISDYQLSSSSDWQIFGLVADAVDPTAFFISYRIKVGTAKSNQQTLTSYKYYAQRWTRDSNGDWSGSYALNIPGQLVRTWSGGGEKRLLLTHDRTYSQATNKQGDKYWEAKFRLNLLREIKLAGKPAAELRDAHSFGEAWLQGLVVDGDRLYLNARRQYNYWYWDDGAEPTAEEQSDRLMIFDLAGLTLSKSYDEPTMTSQVQLMGTHQGKLFVNLPGDGVLMVDVSDPKQPQGVQFVRTLGYASHIEFAGKTGYIAAGHFGVFELELGGESVMPTY